MQYYADYEALEFDSIQAKEIGIFPYYLDHTISETSLCPIFFSACTSSGKIICKQNVFKENISFLKFIDDEITYNKDKDSFVIWFHNVQYDFRIILHELFYNGFYHAFDSKNITYIGEYREVENNTFSIIGENLSKYIGVNIYYKDKKIMIRDTIRIINSSQDKILKDFGYPLKVDINWDSINIDNLKDNIQIIEERNVYDVISLSKCMEEFKTSFYDVFKGQGTTAASMSLDALKHYFCEVNKVKEIDYLSKRKIFKKLYPPIEGVCKLISEGCYSGGICTVNNKYVGVELYDIQMIDVNSSYPHSMTKKLPYGKPYEIKDFLDNKSLRYAEYIVYVEFEHIGVPFQRCNSEYKAHIVLGIEPSDFYYTRSQYPEKYSGYLCINSIDLKTLSLYSNIKKLKFIKGFSYKTNTIIKEYIVPIYEERKLSKGVKKLAIKLLLNSLYGKFAQDLSGIVYQYDDIKNYTKITAIDEDILYKPVASAITSYSRFNWVSTMFLLGDNFIYGDTDSLYFKDIDASIVVLRNNDIIHEDELGKWSFDKDYGKSIKRAKFLSKKNYILDLDDKLKVTSVGFSKRYHNQVTFDNFKIGAKYEICKMKNIYGGKAMKKTDFIIRERQI